MTDTIVAQPAERCEACGKRKAPALNIPIGGGFVSYCHDDYTKGLSILRANAAMDAGRA